MKKIFIICNLVVAIQALTFGQNTFQKHFYSPVEMINSAIQTTDSNIILAGGVRNSSSNDGIFITKINLLGDTLWTKSYAMNVGSQKSSMAKSVVETSDGGLFITGYTQAFSNNYKFCILRTDSLGDTLWTRTVDHLQVAQNYGYSGLQTNDGNFVSFGRQGKFNVDFFLNKFDIVGNLLWTKSYDLQGEFDFGNYVDETYDNGFMMGGTQGQVSNQKIIIMKADSAGNFLWGKKFYGGVSEECNIVKQTADSGYLIGGFTKSFGAGFNDILLIKTNSVGDTLWTRVYGTTSDDQCTSFIQTADQGYVLTGITRNPITGYDQYLLLKLDSNGNSLWSKVYGFGSLYMIAMDVIQTSDNGFLICGEDGYVVKTDEFGNSGCNETSVTLTVSSAPLVISSIIPSTISSAALGFATLNYNVGADFMNQCVGLGIGAERNDRGINIFPNPASEKLTIDLPENLLNSQLYFYDILGEKKLELSLPNEVKYELDISALSPGAYLILIKSEKNVYNGKFIRQ